MISVRDSPRLSEKIHFQDIWLGKFVWAAHDFGYINLAKSPPIYQSRPAGNERLNSNSRVAFDHQIVIIIIKIVFGCRNMKFWPTFASKVTIFNDSGSTFEMSGSGQIEFFSSNGSKILTSQGPGVMALLFGFWAQFGTFFDKYGSEKHPCRCPWRRGNVAPVERNAQGSTPDHPWSL